MFLHILTKYGDEHPKPLKEQFMKQNRGTLSSHNHLKSAAIHFFKDSRRIVFFQMSYCASLQLKGFPNSQMLKFEVQKNGVAQTKLSNDSLDKISLKSKMSDFFSNLKL